jgi:hypothetical protein
MMVFKTLWTPDSDPLASDGKSFQLPNKKALTKIICQRLMKAAKVLTSFAQG